ncbi:MAG TPA: sterol-binding protein [Thiotrichaceae bacterium]|nr:sterol-binding protein [Thiotrichaceae bacterium]
MLRKENNMNTTTVNELPKIPSLLTLPLKFMPSMIPNTALVTVLNRLFANTLREGELDFLQKRVLLIRVQDAKLNFRITLIGQKLVACNHYRTHDLSIEGTAYDFLLLATRREDADTLFFNRRLRLGGDTELGLYVKNFLDALEPEDEQFSFVLKRLENMTNLFEKVGKIQAMTRFKST